MDVLKLIEIVNQADKDYALAMVPADTLKKFAELIWQAAYEEGHDVGVDAGFEAGRNASFTEQYLGVE